MQVDKSSPYYYGLDSAYRPKQSAAPQIPQPKITLDLYGVPQITRPMADIRGSVIPGSMVPATPMADIRGSVTPGSMVPAIDNASADLAFAKALQFQENRKGESVDETTESSEPKLDPNATESYKTAFKAGLDNMGDIQTMLENDPKMQEFAKNFPALAQANFLKTGFNPDGTPKQSEAVAVETAAPDFPYTMADLVGSEIEIGDMYAPQMQTNTDDFAQAFLSDKIQAQKAEPAKEPHPLSHFYSNRHQFK